VTATEQFHRGGAHAHFPEPVFFLVAQPQRSHLAVGLDADGHDLKEHVQPGVILGLFVQLCPVEKLRPSLLLLVELVLIIPQEPDHVLFAKRFKRRQVDSVRGFVTPPHGHPVFARDVCLLR
jgi:hypothetical protein